MSACTRGLALLLALLAVACGPGSEAGRTITASELSERIDAGTAPVILDVRSPAEFAAGHIPGAMNVPHDEVAARITSLGIAPDQELVVHCQSGKRAAMAEEALGGLGFTNLRDLEGHWQGWQGAGLPSE